MTEDINIIFAGIDRMYKEWEDTVTKSAPRCHFRPMVIVREYLVDGYIELCFECSVCGHTKRIDDRGLIYG